ncbi:MAG: hypothetical protein LLF76_09590 [Planctomycetaceae bacterium]|nr:hypothetical protein [Planctomycetaceae bacterium]
MRRSLYGCFRLSVILALAAVCLAAQEQPPKPEPAALPPAKAEPQPSDIWQEISFDSAQDFDLNDARVQHMLDELKRTDPQKSEYLLKLQTQNPKEFVEAVRAEIRKALQPKPPAAEQSAVQEKEPKQWQTQLQKRHEAFMEWFLKEYPADHADLIKLRETDAEKYVQRVMDAMTIYEPIQRTQKMDTALAAVMKKDIELQKGRDALLLQIRKASSEEQPRLLKELNDLVAAQFDTIVQKKELQYELLRKRLAKLEQQLDQQALELENLKKNKAQTVEEHVKELMSRSEKISW